MIFSDITSLKKLGYSLIADQPNVYNFATQVSGSTATQTFRKRHIATADGDSIILVYGNFCGIFPNPVQLNPNYNHIVVAASLQKNGASGATDESGYIYPVFFNGRRKAICDPHALLRSEPSFFDLKKGEIFFTRNYREAILHVAPSAPSLTVNSTGGSLVASSNYYVSIQYVFADGTRSKTSSNVLASTTSGASTFSITVTSPSAITGAIGYIALMSGRNDGAGTSAIPFKASDVTEFGTNITITKEIITGNTGQYAAPNGNVYFPAGIGGAGSNNFEGLNNGDGLSSGDQTLPGFIVNTTQQALSSLYSPVAILGRTLSPQKTIALIGDSIQAGTGDHGYIYQSGGHATRAITNQLGALKYDITALPLYGYVRVPLGGEQAAQFASQANNNSYTRLRYNIAEMATNVICNYGTNDLSLGLSSMQASILTIAKWFACRGIKFFQCTLLPKTTSTDGFQTTTNQTVGGTETTRLQFNAWLRDTSASGFMAQVGYPGFADVIDICKYVEVNSANTLTQNGGLWRIPTGFTPVTGTLTAVTNASQFQDNTKSWTGNQYKGYSVIITSGAQANKIGCLLYNTNAGIMNTASLISGTAPAVGDSYAITILSTIDGTHPSSQGHIWAGQAVAEKFPALI